jgi:hypothetical protein
MLFLNLKNQLYIFLVFILKEFLFCFFKLNFIKKNLKNMQRKKEKNNNKNLKNTQNKIKQK